MDQNQVYDSKTVSILLVSASLVLLANGIYTIMTFSIQYGIGIGAALQSLQTNTTVVSALQFVAGNYATLLYQTLLESFLLTAIGVAMFAIALAMLVHGSNRFESYIRRYMPIHGAMALMYIVVLFIIHATYSFTPFSSNLFATYVALAICILLDIYMEYRMHAIALGRMGIRGININPATPYANLMKLRDSLFGSLSGDVRIVDKHFNSAAVANLYRLLPEGASGINSVSIITSQEMLNSGFEWDCRDLMQELKSRGMSLEVRIMNSVEATEQHERFIFDDNNAYKIPPMNIINKKSEHIVKMSIVDARRRFGQLVNNSVRLDNYAIKHQRDGTTEK